MLDANDPEDEEYRYDPDRDPDPEFWLELDEGERLFLVEDQHRAAREGGPNFAGHATIHTIVENQIAMAIPHVVATMGRLMREGLTRHDALHAVGSVLAELMSELRQPGAKGDGAAINARYARALEKLSAASWLAS
jgi:hypothetical protein